MARGRERSKRVWLTFTRQSSSGVCAGPGYPLKYIKSLPGTWEPPFSAALRLPCVEESREMFNAALQDCDQAVEVARQSLRIHKLRLPTRRDSFSLMLLKNYVANTNKTMASTLRPAESEGAKIWSLGSSSWASAGQRTALPSRLPSLKASAGGPTPAELNRPSRWLCFKPAAWRVLPWASSLRPLPLGGGAASE